MTLVPVHKLITYPTIFPSIGQQPKTKWPKHASEAQCKKIVEWQEQAKKENKAIYVRDDLFKRRMIVTPERDVYIVFNKRSQNDEILGKDYSYKAVRYAEDFFTGQKYATATMDLDNDLEESENELRNLLAVQGLENFVQLKCYVDYTSKKVHTKKDTPTTGLPKKKRRLILELGDAGDLDQAIEQHSLTRLQLRQIILQILRALAVLHEDKKTIHRDLRGPNIFLKKIKEGYKPLIGDMSTACHLENDYERRQIRTSCWYLSPECVKSSLAHGEQLHKLREAKKLQKSEMRDAKIAEIKKEIRKFANQFLENTNPKLDIWSVGCIIHQINRGIFSLPWCHSHEEKPVFSRIKSFKHIAPRDPMDDPILYSLTEQILQVDPQKRPTAAALLSLMETSLQQEKEKLEKERLASYRSLSSKRLPKIPPKYPSIKDIVHH